jgi:phosphoribosylglycinamide formyltransferase-1
MKLGFLASHGGSNMQAIIDQCLSGAIEAKPVILICNNPNAIAVERARDAQLTVEILNGKTHANTDQLDRQMEKSLLEAGVDLVVLAGYMKKIGPTTLSTFSNRILNIHPSLLPRFGGQGMFGIRVHEAVVAAGEPQSGATVHLIDNGYDQGKIIRQAMLKVDTSDTPATLQKRVLELEHILYPNTIAEIASGKIKLSAN